MEVGDAQLAGGVAQPDGELDPIGRGGKPELLDIAGLGPSAAQASEPVQWVEERALDVLARDQRHLADPEAVAHPLDVVAGDHRREAEGVWASWREMPELAHSYPTLEVVVAQPQGAASDGDAGSIALDLPAVHRFDGGTVGSGAVGDPGEVGVVRPWRRDRLELTQVGEGDQRDGRQDQGGEKPRDGSGVAGVPGAARSRLRRHSARTKSRPWAGSARSGPVARLCVRPAAAVGER